MIRFFNWFTKITAWPVQKLCFKTKVYYESRAEQSRRIKGPAIIVSNHTSIFDYAVFLFVFYGRTLRYQMAEVLFKKAVLGTYLKCMGGIYVDRDSNDYGFLDKSQEILERGGVVGIFPEGRIPEGFESKPLEFKPGAVRLALSANVPIIPVYTNGSYFSKKRARVMIGTPVFASELYDEKEDYGTNLKRITGKIREKVVSLGDMLEREV